MSKGSNATVTLGPEQEAERLWDGAQKELHDAGDDLARLSAALGLGVRAAEILSVHRLQAVKDEFPATIAMLLEPPPAEVEPWRDVVHRPKSLDFSEAIDMLSADDLECITPHLHHGWEDRRRSCGRARDVAQRATGVSLDATSRDQLMVLAAYRNRIFSTPPPLRIVPEEIRGAFPALSTLVDRLFGPRP